METFSALLAICAGNSPVPGEFPTQRPVTRSFDVFFDLCLNKRLRKQSRGWWFETLSCRLWRHRNVFLLRSRGHSHLSVFQSPIPHIQPVCLLPWCGNHCSYPLSTNPLVESTLPYYQFDSYEQTSVIFQSKCKYFHSKRCIWTFERVVCKILVISFRPQCIQIIVISLASVFRAPNGSYCYILIRILWKFEATCIAMLWFTLTGPNFRLVHLCALCRPQSSRHFYFI